MRPSCRHCRSRGRHNPGCPAVQRVPPCRHCRTRAGWKARGLCSRCFADRSCRDLYPPRRLCLGQGARKDFCGAAGEPEPTRAIPGTEAKLQVLVERAAWSERLFVRGDAEVDLG